MQFSINSETSLKEQLVEDIKERPNTIDLTGDDYFHRLNRASGTIFQFTVTRKRIHRDLAKYTRTISKGNVNIKNLVGSVVDGSGTIFRIPLPKFHYSLLRARGTGQIPEAELSAVELNKPIEETPDRHPLTEKLRQYWFGFIRKTLDLHPDDFRDIKMVISTSRIEYGVTITFESNNPLIHGITFQTHPAHSSYFTLASHQNIVPVTDIYDDNLKTHLNIHDQERFFQILSLKDDPLVSAAFQERLNTFGTGNLSVTTNQTAAGNVLMQVLCEGLNRLYNWDVRLSTQPAEMGSNVINVGTTLNFYVLPTNTPSTKFLNDPLTTNDYGNVTSAQWGEFITELRDDLVAEGYTHCVRVNGPNTVGNFLTTSYLIPLRSPV